LVFFVDSLFFGFEPFLPFLVGKLLGGFLWGRILRGGGCRHCCGGWVLEGDEFYGLFCVALRGAAVVFMLFDIGLF
jgi:hypothetical protein